jgi:signal transduction histidine kinase
LSCDSRCARGTARFEALFHNARDLAAILGCDGSILAVNRSVPGVAPQYLVGVRADDLIALDDLPVWNAALEQAREQRASATITLRGRLTGSRYELTLVPISAEEREQGAPRSTRVALAAGPPPLEELLVVGRDVHDRDLADDLRRRFTERVLEAQEEERRRVGRELHDVAGGELAGLALQLEQLAGAAPEVSATARILSEHLRAVTEQLSRTARGLHLGPIEELGLTPVLGRIIADLATTTTTAIDVELERLSAFPKASPAVATAICRVVQQALTNTIQHAGAQRATVEFGDEGDAYAI